MLEETRLFIADQLARGSAASPNSSRPTTASQRAAGAPLRDPGRLRQPLPARHVRRRHARRAARAGERPHGHVVSQPHLAGAARPVAPRHVLGSPPPAPPPDVPSLEEAAPGRVLDPARADGGAPQEPGVRHLPRTDGSARLLARAASTRSGSGGRRPSAGPIDATATLPDGSRSTAPRGLRAFLAGHRDDFVRTFTEKLLAYALGRGLEPADMPAVRGIVRGSGRRPAIAGRRSSPASCQSVAVPHERRPAPRANATAGRQVAARH